MKKLLILAAMTLGIAATGVVQAQTVYPQVIGPAGAHAKVGNTTVNATVGQVVNGTTLTGNQLVTQGFQQPYSTQPIDTNLTKYAIGKMTPQSVWQTTSLRFYVYSEVLGPKASLSISVSKPTSGPVTFNPALGYFTFTPAASDTSVFSITFRAKLDSRLDSQVVVFQTQPYLQREQAVFGVGNGQSFPAPDGKEYLIVSDIPLSDDPNATPDFFNQMQRNTRTVSISGMEVVVANGHTNGLYNFNNNEDIRTLNIYGERVVIKDPFDLPQTNVTIYARELVFEDDGYINTTPRKTLGPQTGTTPAIPGVKAGTITLHINKYVSTPMVRLIQIGGDGQDGGQVKAGDAANGGDLYATLEVDAYSDRSGGLGGKFPQIDLLPAIYKGTPGQFIKIEKQNSWLHPNYMRVVRKYADDAYFLGFSEYTRQRAGMYLEEVNRYQASGEWAELSDTLQLELEQLRAEFAKTVTQIDDNLDYFGNPPGWVPMLSFEVNASAFQNEIDHAINVLYLNYWITQSAKSIGARVNALKTSRTEMMAQLEDDKTNFNAFVLKIPQLETEASNNAKDLEKIQADLASLENELIDRAKNSVDERRRGNLWRDIVGTVGQIASVVPVPAVQAAGIGLTLISQFDTGDLKGSAMKAVQAGKDISHILKNSAEIKKNADKWNDAYKASFPLTDIKNFDDAGKKVENLSKAADPFIKTAEILQNVAKNQQNISDQEVQAELSRMRASEPRLGQLTEKIGALHQRQQKIIEEVRSSNENIQRLGNELSSGILTIDAMNRNVAEGSRALDQRTLAYLDNMEQQALYKLKKYYYYMAKAYEYRFLEPYKGNLNLEPLYDKMKEIAIQGTDHVLTTDQFNAFKTIYNDQISDIASDILDRYNSSRPASSTANYFSLTKDELKTLNEGGTLIINMVERGIFFKDREDIRIIDLNVEYMNAKATNGNSGPNAQIELVLEYPNYSKLKKNGQIYFFNNYNLNTTQPIEWAATYFLNNKRIQKTGPSADFQSLIKFLLKNSGDNSNAVIFSRPAAWADIVLRKQDLDQGIAKLDIDSLTFRLDYDFVRKNASTSNIEIIASQQWMAPHFIVSKSDKNQRKDGLGNIHRTYDRNGETLKITAPKQYGKWQFVQWTDRVGNPLPSSVDTVLSLSMNDDYAVMANYRLQEAILNLPDTAYVLPMSGSTELKLSNAGDLPMEWKIDGSSNWITLAQTTSGVALPKSDPSNVTYSHQANANNSARIGYISVVSPDATDYRDTVWVVQSNPSAVSLTTASLFTPFATTVGVPAVAQELTINGANLTGNVEVDAPANFEVSLDATSNFSSKITLTPSNRVVNNVKVYVRYNPGASGVHNGKITVASAGAKAVQLDVNGTSTVPTVAITIGSIGSNSVCAGSSINVPFIINGNFATTNIFRVQLSNPDGRFAQNPTEIGSTASTAGGSINATIPAAASSGNNYRIRIVSSSPAFTSADNGAAIIVNPKPVKPAITLVNGLLTSNSSTGNQWFLNGSSISGATGVSYYASVQGSYSVQVTNECGSGPMSDPVSVTSLETSIVEAIKVYPNPAHEQIRVDLPTAIKGQFVHLINLQGQVITSGVKTGSSGFTVNVSHLPKGLYMLSIQTSRGVVYKKALVQ